MRWLSDAMIGRKACSASRPVTKWMWPLVIGHLSFVISDLYSATYNQWRMTNDTHSYLKPPFTGIICPLMNSAAGEAQKAACWASSSGVPQAPRSDCRTARSCEYSEARSPHAVRIQPGATQLTRTWIRTAWGERASEYTQERAVRQSLRGRW